MLRIIKTNPITAVTIELNFKSFLFPAGETGVKLNTNNYRYKDFSAAHQTIVARIANNNDLMELIMVVDALRRFDKTPINLFLPYVPYARQDRICDEGEAFSIQVFAKLINSLNFNAVTIVDPHSHVTEAVIDNVNVISQLAVINKFLPFVNRIAGATLVSPDAGSNKKVAEVAKFLNHSSFIRADKLRDCATGVIKEIVVYADDLSGKDVVIVDDICERGGTFIGLAAALKAKNCGKIILYVSHGVFAGKDMLDVLAKLKAGGIDEIYTTNSYRLDIPVNDTMNVLDVDARFFDVI